MNSERPPEDKTPEEPEILFPLDRLHVDLDNLTVVRVWCRALSCSEEELREAVRAVRNLGGAVRRSLRR